MRDGKRAQWSPETVYIGILFAWFVFLFLWTSDFAIAEQSPLPTFFSTTTTTAIGISSCWSRVRRPYPPIVWKDRPTGTKRTQQNKTPHTHKQKTFQYSIKKIREFFPFFFFLPPNFSAFLFCFSSIQIPRGFCSYRENNKRKGEGGGNPQREREAVTCQFNQDALSFISPWKFTTRFVCPTAAAAIFHFLMRWRRQRLTLRPPPLLPLGWDRLAQRQSRLRFAYRRVPGGPNSVGSLFSFPVLFSSGSSAIAGKEKRK